MGISCWGWAVRQLPYEAIAKEVLFRSGDAMHRVETTALRLAVQYRPALAVRVRSC
jgi:hypothetical protein